MIKKYSACVSKTGSNESQMVTLKAVQFSIGTLDEVLSLYEGEEYAHVYGIELGKKEPIVGDYFISFRVNGEVHISFIPKAEFEYTLSFGEPIYIQYDAVNNRGKENSHEFFLM